MAVDTSVQAETGFLNPVVSMTTAGTDIYAGTGAAGVAGSGDVYVRDVAGWQMILDGSHDHVVVAALGNDLFAFEGGLGMTPRVSILSAGQWTSSVTLLLPDCVPTQALEDGGALWVGASDATGLGDALLYQGDAAGFTQIALPPGTAGVNGAERCTGLALDPQGDLVIALTTVDVTTGLVQAGRVLRYTGQQTFDEILTLTLDAPLCVAAHAGTVFVGTDSGLLLYDNGSAFVEDATAPQNQGITRLSEADPTTLWVGLRTAQGAALHTRVGPAASSTAGGTSGTATSSYLTHIKPLLGSCVGCHASQSNYRLTTGLADDQADYQATLGVIDTQLPDASMILAKASGSVSHGGGAPWPSNSASYQTVLVWIQQGAAFDGGTAPAAPVIPANPTYVTDVRPIMSTCVGCHANEDDMELSANLSDNTADYMEVLGESNLNDPANSGILTRPTQVRGHPVKVFDVGSVPYDTLLRWVQTGAPFN
jgi:cytochrome c553